MWLSVMSCVFSCIRGAEQIFEGCRRFANPDEQVPLDYINEMMFPLLDALFDKFRLHLIILCRGRDIFKSSLLSVTLLTSGLAAWTRTPAPRIFDQAEPRMPITYSHDMKHMTSYAS